MSAVDTPLIQEMVYELRVGDIMVKEVIVISSSTPMTALRAILRENRISGTPVVDDGKLSGIISIEDFIKWQADGDPDATVADRMTRNVSFVHEDEPLIQAVSKLERLGFGRLPVLSRETGELKGLVTNGDIISGLLMKLDIDARRAETRSARSRHIFEDIVADKSAIVFEYRVTGGEFGDAGTSAMGLKTTLLRLGIRPSITRRAAIATYEAEMNLIFYTDGGWIRARIEPSRIHIEVQDEGPGIGDIEQAMQPGFSTAPDSVRELGFGAGMGLHNIKTCTDRMQLDSVVGEGTCLKLDIALEDNDDAQ